GLLALPLLHLAAAPRATSREGRRALAAALAAWTGPALYGVLFWATSRGGMRGTPAASPPIAALPGEAARLPGEGVPPPPPPPLWGGARRPRASASATSGAAR